MIDTKKNYIEAPFSFKREQFGLLPQILPLLPPNINTFFDLFAESFNVALNVSAEEIVYISEQPTMVNLFKHFYNNTLDYQLGDIEDIIQVFELSPEAADKYLTFRNYYNTENHGAMVLYVLICHALNNQVEFDSENNFNLPFGSVTFDATMRRKFIEFITAIQKKACYFSHTDFRTFNKYNFQPNDVVYCNLLQNKTINWTKEQKDELLGLLEHSNVTNCKFALFASLDDTLREWSIRYNIHPIKSIYGADKEVLITNY